jgi:hypothetical protein
MLVFSAIVTLGNIGATQIENDLLRKSLIAALAFSVFWGVVGTTTGWSLWKVREWIGGVIAKRLISDAYHSDPPDQN